MIIPFFIKKLILKLSLENFFFFITIILDSLLYLKIIHKNGYRYCLKIKD